MPTVTGAKDWPVVSVIAKRKSAQANRNENSPAVTIALRLSGTMIEMNVRQYPAPSILAASESSRGIEIMNARNSKIANGIVAVESARISPR